MLAFVRAASALAQADTRAGWARTRVYERVKGSEHRPGGRWRADDTDYKALIARAREHRRQGRPGAQARQPPPGLAASFPSSTPALRRSSSRTSAHRAMTDRHRARGAGRRGARRHREDAGSHRRGDAEARGGHGTHGSRRRDHAQATKAAIEVVPRGGCGRCWRRRSKQRRRRTRHTTERRDSWSCAGAPTLKTAAIGVFARAGLRRTSSRRPARRPASRPQASPRDRRRTHAATWSAHAR